MYLFYERPKIFRSIKRKNEKDATVPLKTHIKKIKPKVEKLANKK